MTSQVTSGRATTLATNIRLLREQDSLTQRDLADKLGVDPMLVSKWERGKHKPAERNLIALSDVSGRNVAWFYTDHGLEHAA